MIHIIGTAHSLQCWSDADAIKSDIDCDVDLATVERFERYLRDAALSLRATAIAEELSEQSKDLPVPADLLEQSSRFAISVKTITPSASSWRRLLSDRSIPVRRRATFVSISKASRPAQDGPYRCDRLQMPNNAVVTADQA